MTQDGRASVLFVTSELPWPLDSGGHLRTYHLWRALHRAFDVLAIVGVTQSQDREVAELRAQGLRLCPVVLGKRTMVTEGQRLIRALAAGEPYALYRRHDHAAVHEVVRQEISLAGPSVCYLDHLDSFLYARDSAGVPIVLDLHNIYSLILEREATDPSRSWIMRRFLSHEAGLLRKIETLAVTQAAEVLAVSEAEREHFAGLGGPSVRLVPNGVDCGRYAELPIGRRIEPPNILFVGTMSWPANRTAVRFLAEVVLPRIQLRYPLATLTVVGKNPGEEIRGLVAGKAMTLAEKVPDVMPYLRNASLLAVPLDSGGGTRLKILEAFAAGLPVVSTPIGCEGISVTDKSELLIAERDRFAEATIDVLQSPDDAKARAARARTLVEQQYDWAAIGQRAVEAVEALIPARRT